MSQERRTVVADEVMEHRGRCRCKWLDVAECWQFVYCVEFLLLMKIPSLWSQTEEHW